MTAPKEKAILEVHELTKSYDNFQAVSKLSFSINPGEIYGLLGPNGAGKTTTIKSILGMTTIDNGTITVLGYDPVNQPKEVKQQIGYVAEEPLIYESLTIRELFNFIASLRQLNPVEVTQRALNLMDSLDVTKYADDLVATLSKGNKQKVQIICSLIHEPELLILDEPLSGLDAKSRRIVRNILKLHIESGKSVLLTTHAMEDAQGLCDRIGILNTGRMIAEGTLNELVEESKSSGGTLEEVFLKLTDLEGSVENATALLENQYKGSM